MTSLTTVDPPSALHVRSVDDRALRGAVYTPGSLARWLAKLVRESAAGPIESILDPACGHGALLHAADLEIPDLTRLIGVDLDADAAAEIRQRWPDRSSVVVGDTLTLDGSGLTGTQAVVMNPPWGAEVVLTRADLRQAGYQLARGQYDSWDLFIEWTVRALAPGTVVGAIIPDAIFLPEHTATRNLLLDETALRVVARLGEGWFSGVYRGVAVLVYTVGCGPGRDERIRCIRLAHDARREVLAGRLSISAATERAETTASQSDWRNDPESAFLPAAQTSDHVRLRHLDERGGAWQEWFSVGRGVEIGKQGRVVRCESCGRHRPAPRSEPRRCPACARLARWAPIDAIATDETDAALDPASDPDGAPPDGWVRLIVGEDVRRYEVAPSRLLRVGLSGIDYKDPGVYARPKLLVRKTGLGLQAALDTSGSHTLQVVFHYRLATGAPSFAQSYLEGVLCSRPLLAFHLARTGETEWRSHPYVTPRMLATLPIPRPAVGSQRWRQARAVAAAARAVHRATPRARPAAELRVDALVAGLFDLDADGCAWVDGVLARTERLQAFAAFAPAPTGFRPVQVD